MVVEELDQNLAPMAANGLMSIDLVARIYENHGLAWPVSGYKTAGEERHRARRVRDRMLRAQGQRRAVLDGWLAPLPTAGDYCGHGPMDACLCLLNP